MTQIRIGFVGDSITHGTGDETLLGWTYRVGQAEAAKGHDVTVYNLGIRADTSALVEQRWDIEVNARLKPEMNCGTVWAIGINDCAHEKTATTDRAAGSIGRILGSYLADDQCCESRRPGALGRPDAGDRGHDAD